MSSLMRALANPFTGAVWPLDYRSLSPFEPGYGRKVCIYTGCDRVPAAWFITSYDFKPLCSHHLLVFPGYR